MSRLATLVVLAGLARGIEAILVLTSLFSRQVTG